MEFIFEVAGAIFLAAVLIAAALSLIWGMVCVAVRIFPGLAPYLTGRLQAAPNGKRNNHAAHGGAVKQPSGAVQERW